MYYYYLIKRDGMMLATVSGDSPRAFSEAQSKAISLGGNSIEKIRTDAGREVNLGEVWSA